MLPQRPFAFFDFDGTLTRRDTVLPFIRYYLDNDRIFLKKLLPLAPLLCGYLLGRVGNAAAKEAVCGAYLAGEETARVEAAAARFAAARLPEMLRGAGMAKLREHQGRGDVCVLVSASPEWYLTAWARAQGFDGVFGTRMAEISGCLNGKIDGENCYGAGKVRRIEAAYGADCWRGSTAYSDSWADAPMLAKAERAFLWRRGAFRPFRQPAGCLKNGAHGAPYR